MFMPFLPTQPGPEPAAVVPVDVVARAVVAQVLDAPPVPQPQPQPPSAPIIRHAIWAGDAHPEGLTWQGVSQVCLIYAAKTHSYTHLHACKLASGRLTAPSPTTHKQLYYHLAHLRHQLPPLATALFLLLIHHAPSFIPFPLLHSLVNALPLRLLQRLGHLPPALASKGGGSLLERCLNLPLAYGPFMCQSWCVIYVNTEPQLARAISLHPPFTNASHNKQHHTTLMKQQAIHVEPPPPS